MLHPPLAFEVGFERDSYTIDEVTGRFEVNITSDTPFPGPTEVVLTMTTVDGTAVGKSYLNTEFRVYTCTRIRPH